MMRSWTIRSRVEKRRERLEAGTCGLGCSDALWKRTDAPLGCSEVEALLGSQAPLLLSGSSAPLVAVGGRPAAGGTTQLLAPPPNNQSPLSS